MSDAPDDLSGDGHSADDGRDPTDDGRDPTDDGRDPTDGGRDAVEGEPSRAAPDEGRADPLAERDADELEELRREVEEKYDFEDFGPADMAEMSLEEWEVAFDPETWITGEELLDRLEDDLAARVANREVFARIERRAEPPRLVAYSDEGYAVVYPDGSVTGEGTVLRDVKPSVALSSMESYDVPEPPEDATLPEPEEVPEQSGELGNLMLQVVAGIQFLAALVLFGAGLFAFGSPGSNSWILFAAGIGFLVVGLLLFFTVANARLSDAFRAEEYRNRLRAVGSSEDGRPDFLPPEAAGTDANADGERTAPLADRSDDPQSGDGAVQSDPSSSTPDGQPSRDAPRQGPPPEAREDGDDGQTGGSDGEPANR